MSSDKLEALQHENAELRAERDEARAEVARYWTSADMKPWVDLAEQKGLGHFGKKLKGMFSRAMKAEDDARQEFARAEDLSRQLAEKEEARAEQWRLRREAEGSRDVCKAACDTMRFERDEARSQLAEARVALSDIADDKPLDLRAYARAALSGSGDGGWRAELPELPDDDSDFTPDLARKIIAKYQEYIRRLAAAPATAGGE